MRFNAIADSMLPIAVLAASLLLAACGNSRAPAGAGPGAGAGGTPPVALPGAPNPFAMANGCFGVRNVESGRFLRAADDGSLAFDAESTTMATGFFMKPSGLGRYLFFDPQERFMSLASDAQAAADTAAGAGSQGGATAGGAGDVIVLLNPLTPVGDGINDAGDAAADGGQGAAGTAADAARSLRMSTDPADGSEWDVTVQDDAFGIVNSHTGQALGVATGDDSVGTAFEFERVSQACADFPEAELNASGTPFSGTNPDGTVFGYAETHMHLGGSEALGGQIGYGRPFHRFGITHALDDCEANHGPGGSGDALDAFVNPNQDTPQHETQGWPTFNDWPSHGGQTHHQTYHVWLKRAWLGGLRFMVNHLVANEMLCVAWPQKENDCNEMENARLQLRLVEELQDYIDAQEGGPGQGFFRIVYTPEEARQVIEAGKMAVINGIELEKPFDCGEYLDSPECTEEDIDAALDEWYAMGLRAVFPIHIFDNAFGGAEISRFTSDQALIQVYNAGNIAETGHPYATIPCEEAEAVGPGEAEPEDRDIFGLVALQALNPPPFPTDGCVNNARPLTTRGEFFINRLIDHGMIIETDHSGPLARKRMLDIALARGVPVVSGHTGSITVSRDSKRIIETGGILSNLSDDPAPVTIEFIQDLEAAHFEVFGTTQGLSTGFGSDINGIHRQAGPRDDVADKPLVYPFTSYAGDITFDRQVSGERVFDHNVDGVAHYGLYPDYIADIQMTPGGEQVLAYLFRSAEGYLRVWETVHAARTE